MSKELDTIDELNIIGTCLDDASEYGLECEVVYFALKYMKQDPTLSIIQAITYGYDEWVK
jgi:hypothetical protein